MMGYRQQRPKIGLTVCPDLVDHDKAPEQRVEPFSREDLSRLLAVTNIENHRLMIEFLFWTGMRPAR